MLDLDEANSRRGPQVATNLNRANKENNQFATKKKLSLDLQTLWETIGKFGEKKTNFVKIFICTKYLLHKI